MKKTFSLKKRGTLLALISFLCLIGLKAQTWTAPAYEGSAITTATQYFVYNVGANGFLNRGGEWAAQSVVSAAGFKMTATSSGALWVLQYESNTKTLFRADVANGWTYTDNSTNNTWDIQLSDAVNNVYTIQSSNDYGGYNASQYLGASATTYTSNKGICSDVRYNRAGGDNYTKWLFVTDAGIVKYDAKVLLDRYMTYAKNKGMDVTSYIATYNAGVTADINAAAATLLTALGRTDVTSSISNPSFENATALLGWTNAGSFAKQTNVPGQGWTKDGSAFCEKYISNTATNYLGVGTITQTVTGLANGLYGLVASAHAVKQFGANPLHTGAFVTAGAVSTEVSGGKEYSVENVTVTDGTLSIGFKLQTTVTCNWVGFDNFKLYYYGPLAIPVLSASKTQFAFNGGDSYITDSLTVSGSNLSNPISISAPAGVTVNPTTLSANASGAKVYVTYDRATPVNGNIAFTSGSTTTNVAVTGAPGADCYSPLYSTGNMIADPRFSAASLAIGGYSGWGPTAISKSNPYCGSGSAYIRGSCWPDGGSLDRALNAANGNALKPLTKYRLRAMVNSQASVGKSFQFEIQGVDGASSILFQIPNTNGWKQIDTTFTTGATVTEHGIYFNSCTTPPAITDTCFIDNYELFTAPKVYSSSTALTFLGLGSKKVAVRAEHLSQVITITASTGFSVSPSTLASTVSGGASDSLTVTFNGPNSASGYVYFTSGGVKDSIQVTGTVAPSLITSVPYVSLDELNNSATFTVTGGNLVAGISMSAPAGITLTPSTLPSSANGTTVTVSYDGNATSSGYIKLTSSTASATVRVRAVRNADSHTPLYSSGNLVSDTYLNDLANFGGWGNHIINTDTAFVYSGSRSGKVFGGQCAGSLDQVLTGIMKPDTKYRVKAMVYALGGSFQIGVYGWSNGKADTTSLVSTTGSWQTVDFEFITGATLGANQGMFFNSCWTGGQTGYIDNWEAYEVSNPTGLNILNKDNQKVYIANNKLVSDFVLNKESIVTISVYDMQGKLISKYNNWCDAGRNTKTINAPISKGIYIVKIVSDEFSLSKKLTK